MPLTTDEKLLNLSRDVVAAFDKADGGVHPGFRPAHAKGILLTGAFTPSKEATSLTRAPHIQRASTPVTVRLSNFAGIPTVADNDPQNASPRGFAHPLPPRRTCPHRHRRPLRRHFPLAHRRRIPGISQRPHRDRPSRTAPKRHRTVPRHPSRSPRVRPSPQAHPNELRQRVVLRRLCLQIHQRRRRQPIWPLSHTPCSRQRISGRRGRSRKVPGLPLRRTQRSCRQGPGKISHRHPTCQRRRHHGRRHRSLARRPPAAHPRRNRFNSDRSRQPRRAAAPHLRPNPPSRRHRSLRRSTIRATRKRLPAIRQTTQSGRTVVGDS